jgi:Ca2+-binding RTX toxin-like protein
MTVEPVVGPAIGLSWSTAVLRALIALTLTIATGAAFMLPTPRANAERIVGTDREDDIIGTAQTDRILARGGDDQVFAGTEADFVSGGPGDDIIHLGRPETAFWERVESASGGPGFDVLFGTGARDRLNGGPGDDLLFGAGRADMLTDGDGLDDLNGTAGRDLIRLTGGGADVARGGPDGDIFIVVPDGSRDRMNCGRGRDTVEFRVRREKIDETTGCEIQRVGLTDREFFPRSVAAGR